MELMVLAVPGCPSAPLLADRLAGLRALMPQVHVVQKVVGTEEEAVRLGMRGSPTLLIDGADLFPAPGESPALACRLAWDDGYISRTPGREERSPAT